MPKILETKSIYYNDCNLIAQPVHEDIKTRLFAWYNVEYTLYG